MDKKTILIKMRQLIDIVLVFIFLYAGRKMVEQYIYLDNSEMVQQNFALSTAVSGKIFSGDYRRLNDVPKTSITNNFQFVDKCTVDVVGVVTTLNLESKCILDTATVMPVVVVGDAHMVSEDYNKNDTNFIYLSLTEQHATYPALSRFIPEKNFARKNLGYLHALVALKACHVYDFDDDNCMSDSLKSVFNPTRMLSGDTLWAWAEDYAVNPYLVYGAPSFIWPRGYPLDLLEKRAWPIISSTEPQTVDVIQFIQSIDPDVDAVWRLLHGTNVLPMSWHVADHLKSKLFGIARGHVAPFNAQAVLLSRRALVLAYLPWTVHGRVSDIWRSFVMQYVLNNLVNPGHVVFSGEQVMHHRSSHNYLADLDAEEQLYEQSREFIKLITVGQTNTSRVMSIIELMNELYCRGYVDKGDVDGLKLWMDYVQPILAFSHSSKVRDVTTYALPVKQNVLGVLHINHRLIQVLPMWMALHSHFFERGGLKVYVPGLKPCRSLSGVEVNCISDDSAGYFAYESVVHAIENSNINEYEGVLFMHDDVVWNTGKKFEKVSMLSSIGKYGDINWGWWDTNVGVSAMRKFLSLYHQDEYAISQSEFRFSQSDFYFISKIHAELFVKVATAMRKSEVFLEIALANIFAHYLKSDIDMNLRLFTDWTDLRNDVVNTLRNGCNSNYDYVHPLKLLSADGISGHVSCSRDIFTYQN